LDAPLDWFSVFSIVSTLDDDGFWVVDEEPSLESLVELRHDITEILSTVALNSINPNLNNNINEKCHFLVE
jgi:hypothetical protein